MSLVDQDNNNVIAAVYVRTDDSNGKYSALVLYLYRSSNILITSWFAKLV